MPTSNVAFDRDSAFFAENIFRRAYVRLGIIFGHMPERIEKFTKIDHSPLTGSIFAHFYKISFWAALRKIKPKFVQNAFGIAPTGLRTSLEHIPDHIKNLTKIDLLMMPTSNFASGIALMICEIWGCPALETLLPVLASGF